MSSRTLRELGLALAIAVLSVLASRWFEPKEPEPLPPWFKPGLGGPPPWKWR